MTPGEQIFIYCFVGIIAIPTIALVIGLGYITLAVIARLLGKI